MFGALLAVALLTTDGGLEQNGWKCVRKQPQDAFTVKDGVVTLVCSPNPYKGSVYGKSLESLPEKGELSFEVRPMLPGSAHSNRYYLQVCCGSMMLSFGSQSMIRYFAKPVANWKVAGKDCLTFDAWNRVRVRWDNARKTVRYYVNDMRRPSCIEENAVVGPDESGDGSCTLRLGNYGLAEGFQTHQIRNLSVVTVTDGSLSAVPRDTALVFHGLCSEFFPIASWTKAYPREKIVDFYLEFMGSNTTPVNACMLSAYPDEDLCRSAGLIILADMPLTAGSLAYSAQENLLAAVRDGARLIVTGGLAGLQRGGGYDSPIAKVLPVKLESPWKAPEGGNVFKRDYGKGKIAVVISARDKGRAL